MGGKHCNICGGTDDVRPRVVNSRGFKFNAHLCKRCRSK